MVDGSRRQGGRKAPRGCADARRLALTLALAAVAAAGAGCDRAGGGEDAVEAVRFGLVLTDAAAPEAFQLQAQARRAGADAAGGDWVAAPGVRRAERVVVENLDTGATAEAALFRSSDGGVLVSGAVADAIGVAGARAPVRITAIRTEPGITDRSR